MELHTPVLLSQVVKSLNIKSDGIYVDCTLGRGGHSSEILKNLKTGKLICIDKDKDALKESKNFLESISNKFVLVHSDFSNISNILKDLSISSVDGILIDLGVSSPQLDNADRGFSYNKDSRLDMRMNQDQTLSAWEVVNEYSYEDLRKALWENSENKFSNSIARSIVQNRPIDTTGHLVDVIRRTLPNKVVRQKNYSKVFFQAIRMEVNNELESLKKVINDSVSLLNDNGTLAIITFHSIEDRVVKNCFKSFLSPESNKLPIITKSNYYAKQLRPEKLEIEQNNRSRSSKLRTLTKIG